MIPEILAAAKAEGQVTVYSSTNEQEGLPLLKLFQDVTGVKINYIRGAEGPLVSRIMTETRAGQASWDIMHSTAVSRLPPALTKTFEPPEAKNLRPEARDPNKKWYGVYAAYNAPAYNTSLVKKEDLPKTYEEFLTKKQWAGRVAIDTGDREWMLGILRHFGEQRGRKLLEDLVRDLNPVVVDGHLALARALAAGEHMVAISNYTMLTSNMQLTGAPTEFFPLDPVSMFISQVGVSAKAPHPNTALLAANFLISREAQQFAAKTGRLPTRDDVEPTPKDALERLNTKKVIPILIGGDESRAAQKTFDEIFKKR
jgi:iron(III) transport system substrate-binding protein